MQAAAPLFHLLGSNTGITPVTVRFSDGRGDGRAMVHFPHNQWFDRVVVGRNAPRQSPSTHRRLVKRATLSDQGPPPSSLAAISKQDMLGLVFGFFFVFSLFSFLCAVEKAATAAVQPPTKWSCAPCASCAASDPFQQHLPTTTANSTSCCASIQPT